MISLDNMLFFIFTKKRLLAGVQTPDRKPQVLSFQDHWYFSYEGKSIPTVIENAWNDILDAYNQVHGPDSSAPIALSLPANLEEDKKSNIQETLNRLGGDRFSIFFEDQLAASFVHGLLDRADVEGKKSIILEALDDYLNLWYLGVAENSNPGELMGKEAFLSSEDVKSEQIKEIGPSTGRSRLMAELIKKFQGAGLSLNLDSQTELAHQLITPAEDFTFNIVQNSDKVVLQGKATFEQGDFEDLYTVNRDKLKGYVSSEMLEKEDIKHIFLMGEFFQNQVMKNFLKENLQVGDRLIEIPYYNEKLEFETIFRGLALRAEMILSAEIHREEVEAEEARKREEEEKKRKEVKAELETKDARESLFSEIRTTCIDPSKQEEYEQQFIPLGEQLGIPDVVIKWNISEILSKISLTEVAHNIGIIEGEEGEDPSRPTIEPETIEISQNGHEEKREEKIEVEPLKENREEEKGMSQEAEPMPSNTHQVNQNGHEEKVVEVEREKEEEKAPVAEVQIEDQQKEEESREEEKVFEEEKAPEPQEETAEPEPVFVLSPAERGSAIKATATKEAKPVITLKEEDTEPVNKATGKKQRFSLGDIFSLKSDLKDQEFLTKVVSFKADSVLQTLRLLKDIEMLDPAKVEAFKKLHLKEMDYYGNVSDISEAKEGLYFYRPFIERTSLKNYLINNGFNKKEKVDSLSSNELKFMLMVFKEVRSLSQPHAALSEETIIVQEKRKWSLQKNVEITFVGFTSEDVSNNDMVEATHLAFSRVMGDSFYKDFRKKFQL